jgi:hypothetical protein
MLAMNSLGTVASVVGVSQAAFGQVNPLQRVRAVAGQSSQAASPPPSTTAPPTRDGGAMPSRSLPRGSLLDLSV